VRDLVVRCVYLGALVFFVTVVLYGSGLGAGGSLDQLSKASTNIFRNLSYLQLGLVALLAPIYTAGAITQEKDSQTYDILLSTPLTNGQIVLGTLMSRLFFVVALLISGVPVFSITQVFGGVAIASIVTSFLIAAATAVATGALAIAIATFKVGTRRTIFSFYLMVVVYLVGGVLLDRLDAFRIDLISPAGAAGGTVRSTTSWLTALNPFLSLETIFRRPGYLPPTLSDLPEALRVWPLSWMWTAPASFYVSLMLAFSAVTVLPSIALLRRLAQSTLSLKGMVLSKLGIKAGDRNRKPRNVWSNPIAWREARTKASAARASVLRYTFILAGVGGTAATLFLFGSEVGPPARWTSRGGYDPVARTVLINGDNQTYGVAPTAEVTLSGQKADASLLYGRYEVADMSLRVIGGVKTITRIDLRPTARRLDANTARQFLLGMVVLELTVILLIVTNAAASTVTREKEDGTLDLLLSTPITSRYYIWGKLRGLVSFALPMLAVPLASVAMFVVYDLLKWVNTGNDEDAWLVLPEALIALPGMFIIVTAFSTMVGMQMSLRMRTTVKAVMSSIGMVLGACGLLGFCGYQLTSNSGNSVAVVLSSFSPFTAVTVLLWPQQFAQNAMTGVESAGTRLGVTIFSLVATGVYTAIVYAMYKSMVTNFDMTIRKQSR
jgi:ABC-type transport system involved in multi-copper enzyme maturation permease subunit